MKYIKILSLALCTVVLTTGCDGFLKEVSQDEVIPSSADDLQQLLLGEGYQTYRQFMPYHHRAVIPLFHQINSIAIVEQFRLISHIIQVRSLCCRISTPICIKRKTIIRVRERHIFPFRHFEPAVAGISKPFIVFMNDFYP